MTQPQIPLLTLLLLSTTLLLQPPFTTCTTDDARLADLTRLQRASRNGVIPFSTAAFSDFLEASPRSYGVIVAMTTHNCQECPRVTREMARVAAEYRDLPARRSARAPLFFAALQFSPGDEPFFVRYRMRHVPVVYYFRPGRADVAAMDEHSPDNFPMQRLELGANTLREFVNARTGARLKVVKANYKVPFVGTVRQYRGVILLLVMFVAIGAVYTHIYKKPMFWFALVMLVYIFSVGGGHYSWIHDVPLVVVNHNGVTEYVTAGSRSQYVAEGFFVSATCVSISVLVILINELPSMVPDKEVHAFAGIILFSLTIFAITILVLLFSIVSHDAAFPPVFVSLNRPDSKLTSCLRKRDSCTTENAAVLAILGIGMSQSFFCSGR